MKSFRVIILTAVVLTLTLAFAACKKKETAPTAVTGAPTAKTADVAVTCPKPGEDLICQDCKTLFMTDQEYADHMEKQHPDKWTKIKDEFWGARKSQPGGTATK